jgi:hypothetical protein
MLCRRASFCIRVCRWILSCLSSRAAQTARDFPVGVRSHKPREQSSIRCSALFAKAILGWRPARLRDPSARSASLGMTRCLMPRELVLDQTVNKAGDGRMIEAIDDFIQETTDQKLLRDRRRDAAREKIKHLVLIDLT